MAQSTGEENARKFFEEMQKEPDNRKAIYADLVRLAKDRGYECTIGDLTKVLRELWGATKDDERNNYSEPPAY